MFFYFDPMYFIFVGPALLVAIWAQMKVKSTFAHYGRVRSASGLTGAEAAERVLRQAGIHDVRIEQVGGFLSDHYDPRKKVLRLSAEVYGRPSVAAIGVAAHEAGHAIQDARGYAALGLRSYLVPTAQFGSWLAFPLIFIGLIFHMLMLAKIGLILFGAVVAFQLVTLPVEFNATSRAKAALRASGALRTDEEAHGVSAVLSAAGWTYVAGALAALMQLLYFAFRLGLLGGRD
jgi:hypothetical protein